MFGEANFPFKSVIALVALEYRSNMNFRMFYKILLTFVDFAAMVALEWSFPSVRPHVSLQIIRSSASIVALVTL